MQKSCRTRKHLLLAIPGSNEEMKKVLDEINEDDVTLPKEVFMELIKKTNMRQLTACQCRCTCGFYPPYTKLTAAPTYTEQISAPSNETTSYTTHMNHHFVRRNQEPYYPEQWFVKKFHRAVRNFCIFGNLINW